MPSQVLTKRRVKRRQQRIRLVSKNAKRKVQSVCKHRKTAKKVMRGGGFKWTKVFDIKDKISSINPEFEKEPEVRKDVFTISINKALLSGSSYNITLTVDLDKYPGLLEDKINGPYKGIPFKYKNTPFMPEFSPHKFEGTRVERVGRTDRVTEIYSEEKSNGREDVNIILNALVYFLFRKTDMSAPIKITMLPGKTTDPLFSDKRLRIGNLGKRPDFEMVLLVGDNRRMTNKLSLMHQNFPDNGKANGQKCIVNMRLYYDSNTEFIKLVVDSHSGFSLTTPMLSDKWSLDMVKAKKVITEMKIEDKDKDAFFKELETKLTTLGQEKGTFYQGAIDYVMVPNPESEKSDYVSNVYFTFDDPTTEIINELNNDEIKLQALIDSSLQACEELKGKKSAMDDEDTKKNIKKCFTFISPEDITLDLESIKVTKREHLKHIITKHNEALEKTDDKLWTEISEMKQQLKQKHEAWIQDEQAKSNNQYYPPD